MELVVEELRSRPLAGVAVLLPEEAGRVGGPWFAFVAPRRGALSGGVVVLEGDSLRVLGSLGEFGEEAERRLRECSRQKNAVRMRLRRARDALEEMEAGGRDAERVARETRAEFEKLFGDVYLPTDEAEDLADDAANSKSVLRNSSFFLTASQLFLSTSGAVFEVEEEEEEENE